jgi:glycosyltransferase involved in cell wall biosynthesis
MQHEVESVFHTPSDKIDVVPNGVDTTPFDVLDGHEPSAFRRQFALDEEEIIFYVGRVVQEKGVHLLVEALPKILARRPNAKLVVAGTGGSLDPARERAAELGLGDKALFTGFISDDDRNRLFRAADVAVFPSLYEPFGIVALEAMAARTPVVVANVGGLGEVVRNHETGLLIYPDDVDSLVWGVLHTLDHPEWARQRVENAYRVVRERFGWQTIAASTVAIYRRIVAERRATDW